MTAFGQVGENRQKPLTDGESTVKRTLTLRSETLSELTTDQLTAVAGGVLPTTPVDICLDKFFETKEATRCFCP